MPGADFSISLWMQRIVNAAALARCFTNNQESDISISIVDEDVSDASTCGKPHTVTGLQAPDFAVQPKIWLTFDHENELFLISLGMRP